MIEIPAIIITGVVSPFTDPVADSQRLFSAIPYRDGCNLRFGGAVLYYNPKEIEADRLLNAVAAFHKLGGPLVVIDFGAATQFGIIPAKGEYLGGGKSPKDYHCYRGACPSDPAVAGY